jgi:hypothetical protein
MGDSKKFKAAYDKYVCDKVNKLDAGMKKGIEDMIAHADTEAQARLAFDCAKVSKHKHQEASDLYYEFKNGTKENNTTFNKVKKFVRGN